MLGRLNRFIYRRLSRVVCLDDAMVELCRKWTPPSGGAMFRVVPNWEPAAMFDPDVVVADWVGPVAESLAGRFVVLYLGNAGYAHDFETVLAAADRLRDEPFAFLFVGGGARWGELQGAKRDRRLDNVLVHAYVPKDQTPSVMKAAHCALITLSDACRGVCSPSKMHATLAMGLPIVYVGPDATNVDVAIDRFRCGVSLRHGDVDGLVAFLRELAGDRSSLAVYAGRSRAAFDEAYCDRQTLGQFDAVIAAISQADTKRGGGPGLAEPDSEFYRSERSRL
jgi:glycosyltransferase involved in cell wall biosynthesis